MPIQTLVLLPLDATGPDALRTTVDVVRALEDSGVDAVALLPGGLLPALEPVTAAAALARRTDRIGILASDPVGVGFPYNTARRLASLDHVGQGRTGWFATGEGGVHDAAFVGVVRDLWRTWDPGAQQPDKSSGDFHDDSRIHAIDPVDPHYRVRGPLDTPPTAWGPPVIVADGRRRVPAWVDLADLVVVDGVPAGPRELESVEGVLDLAWAKAFGAAVSGRSSGASGPLRSRFDLEVLA